MRPVAASRGPEGGTSAATVTRLLSVRVATTTPRATSWQRLRLSDWGKEAEQIERI